MELSYRGNTSFFEIIKLNEFTDNLLLLLSTKLESMNLKPQAGWWGVGGGGGVQKERVLHVRLVPSVSTCGLLQTEYNLSQLTDT